MTKGLSGVADSRQHVHELIDRLPPAQLAAVAGLLETMVDSDPVAQALSTAEPDDEPETEEETRAVQEARDWIEQNGGRGIPHDEAMRRLGLK